MRFELKPKDFARAFGSDLKDIRGECRTLIARSDFTYRKLKEKERDHLILEVLKKIDADTQVIAAPERCRTWEGGWAENLKEFVESGHDLAKLVPKFIKPRPALRLNQDFIRPNSPSFELDYVTVLRAWFFEKYFKDISSIYEFGCGSGFNLVALAQMYPKKKLYGLDFVSSSVNLINKIGEVYGWNIQGHFFDMAKPDEKFMIEKECAVFTFGAVEQLASQFEPFLQFLLKRSPRVSIHIEPTVELYDENNLVDYLAMKFHRKRGYTENFLPRLRELEKQGKIKILKVQRLFFGSLYMEGYNLIVWRCIR